MDTQTRISLFLSRTPIHNLLKLFHRKLARYMDVADNWNNGDESTNGEAFLIKWIAPHLRIAFDVGANLGNWSALLLGANPHCVVFAFEASPNTFSNLKDRYRACGNVKLYQTGLGEQQGTLCLHDYGDNSGLTSFISRETSLGLKPNRLVEVPLTTVDAFCAANALDHIDFIKVDTEGYEMAVLRGMKSCLAGRHISMIQFEYGGTWLDAHETLADAAKLLRDHQYELYRLRPQCLERIHYDCHRHECFKYSNFVAVASSEIIRSWNVPIIKT